MPQFTYHCKHCKTEFNSRSETPTKCKNCGSINWDSEPRQSWVKENRINPTESKLGFPKEKPIKVSTIGTAGGKRYSTGGGRR